MRQYRRIVMPVAKNAGFLLFFGNLAADNHEQGMTKHVPPRITPVLPLQAVSARWHDAQRVLRCV
jgi:hypothetical protein